MAKSNEQPREKPENARPGPRVDVPGDLLADQTFAEARDEVDGNAKLDRGTTGKDSSRKPSR